MLGLLIRDLFAKRTGSAPDKNSFQDVVQSQARAAVVLQTVLRPSVERAIRSVFAQDIVDRIHLLIGVDKRLGDPTRIDRLLKACPANVSVTVFDPGYSTSSRHGGVHTNHFGGALRTILSFAANSRYVAYLDDDDWYAENHLSTLLNAVRGHDWAFSRRWFVNPYNLEPMCVDTIENLGPGEGIYARAGGFACPSSLMIDKKACAPILHLWSEAGRPQGDAEDRIFFKALCDHFGSYGATNEATVNCIIKPEDGSHPIREKIIAESGYPLEKLRESSGHEYSRV